MYFNRYKYCIFTYKFIHTNLLVIKFSLLLLQIEIFLITFINPQSQLQKNKNLLTNTTPTYLVFTSCLLVYYCHPCMTHEHDMTVKSKACNVRYTSLFMYHIDTCLPVEESLFNNRLICTHIPYIVL